MTRWWPRNKCWSLLVCTEEGNLSLVCSANPPSFINLLVIGIEIPENCYITLFSPLLLISTFHSSLLRSESFQIIRSPDHNEAIVWCKGCRACCCKTKIFPSEPKKFIVVSVHEKKDKKMLTVTDLSYFFQYQEKPWRILFSAKFSCS